VFLVSNESTIVELQRHLLYAFLGPVASLAKRFRIPLEELERLTRLAYYEDLRKSNATHPEIAEMFGTSLRTVAGVSKHHRSDFLEPQEAVELIRRLEETLAETAR
jgi:hypothetical protein